LSKVVYIALFLLLPVQVLAANYGRFNISGPPTEQELTKFKQKGNLILDLRTTPEVGEEPAVAKKLGLQYERVDYDAKAETIDPQVIGKIEKVLKTAGDKPVLLFCGSGNRAASYVAIHLVKDKKMPVDEAIKIAKDLGMSGGMEAKVRAFLANARQ
jgi:protein tyrosine phosphatase (PTP) superfamily phosphohydrolase (DUF442 family)